jgi:hypothetical protein
LWLFTAIVALYCLWVLSLPLFPTQDGPVHLYLASIFKGLLAHTDGIYPKYYLVKHHLPPYSFQYYLLVALMSLMSPLLAERLFVCLILVSFAFGFRYLATGIGENGAVFSLLGLGLLLNWSLAMGFENYVLSLSMAFWALGLWTRARHRAATGQRVGMVLLLYLMTLTHPVPVAIVLGFAVQDVVLTQFVGRIPRDGAAQRPAYLVSDIATLVFGAASLFYISAFTEKHRTAENIRNTIHPLAEFRSFYLHLEGVRFFNGPDWPVHLYSFGIYLLLIAAAVTVFSRRRHASTHYPAWRAAFVIFLIVMSVVPMDINGSHMFATRLVVIVWLSGLAAASATRRLPRPVELASISFAVFFSLGILWLAHRDVSREARQIAELTTSPISQHGKLGLVLPGLEQHQAPAYDYVLDPFVWAGAHYFREGSNVMLNTPWTDIPILPVNATPALGLSDFDPLTIEFFYQLRSRIKAGDAQTLELLSRADFILFTTGGQTPDKDAIMAILQAEAGSQWSCTQNTSWTEVCARSRP